MVEALKINMLKTLAAVVMALGLVFGFVGASAPQVYGTAKGRTLFFVSGHPGALFGKPDPKWKAPEPQPVPNVKVYWLRVDRNKGHQLFSTQSDTNGLYEIKLPPGHYLFECESLHDGDLERLKSAGKVETNSLIRTLFTVYKQDEKGREIFVNEPGVEIKAGKTHEQDIAASVMFVD
jgi:hypothetical protein